MLIANGSRRLVIGTIAPVIAAACVWVCANAQSPATDAPWPIRLGMRAIALSQRIPTQDRVVLVPDEATFLDEIGRWSPNGRWPVLIEDSVYTPMFIRAFAPKQVARRTERAPAPADAAALRHAIDASVTRALGGDAATQSPLQALQALGLPPVGLAAYSTTDPAFVAAAALAAGRGLLPVPIEGNFGAINDQLDAKTFAALDHAVTDAFVSTQLPYAQMGDTLDAFVLCRNAAHATALDLSTARVPTAQGMPPIQPGEPFSVTDALCRAPSGARYAVCGHIFGTSARAAYAAMSSLFLQRSTIWAIDSYGASAPPMQSFRVEGMDTGLQAAGFTALVRWGEQAHLPAWREWLAKGFDCDVLLLNSSGNADFFDLGMPGKTPPSSCGAPGDIPVLTRPLALSMVHSFSLQQPDQRDTIGGRWLDGGAYAYVGSVHEPYIFAFVAPGALMEQLANGVPFGVAARVWEGPFSLSWRLALLGDPLMMCIAPKGLPPAPRKPATPLIPGQIDVVANCRALLSRCKDDVKGDATLTAMKELAAAGQDRLLLQLWNIVSSKPWAARCASGSGRWWRSIT